MSLRARPALHAVLVLGLSASLAACTLQEQQAEPARPTPGGDSDRLSAEIVLEEEPELRLSSSEEPELLTVTLNGQRIPGATASDVGEALRLNVHDGLESGENVVSVGAVYTLGDIEEERLTFEYAADGPLASAGEDVVTLVGQPAVLDGTASEGANGDEAEPLESTWTVEEEGLETAEDPSEEPADEQVDEPSEEPGDDPTDDPTDDPAIDPSDVTIINGTTEKPKVVLKKPGTVEITHTVTGPNGSSATESTCVSARRIGRAGANVALTTRTRNARGTVLATESLRVEIDSSEFDELGANNMLVLDRRSGAFIMRPSTQMNHADMEEILDRAREHTCHGEDPLVIGMGRLAGPLERWLNENVPVAALRDRPGAVGSGDWVAFAAVPGGGPTSGFAIAGDNFNDLLGRFAGQLLWDSNKLLSFFPAIPSDETSLGGRPDTIRPEIPFASGDGTITVGATTYPAKPADCGGRTPGGFQIFAMNALNRKVLIPGTTYTLTCWDSRAADSDVARSQAAQQMYDDVAAAVGNAERKATFVLVQGFGGTLPRYQTPPEFFHYLTRTVLALRQHGATMAMTRPAPLATLKVATPTYAFAGTSAAPVDSPHGNDIPLDSLQVTRGVGPSATAAVEGALVPDHLFRLVPRATSGTPGEDMLAAARLAKRDDSRGIFASLAPTPFPGAGNRTYQVALRWFGLQTPAPKPDQWCSQPPRVEVGDTAYGFDVRAGYCGGQGSLLGALKKAPLPMDSRRDPEALAFAQELSDEAVYEKVRTDLIREAETVDAVNAKAAVMKGVYAYLIGHRDDLATMATELKRRIPGEEKPKKGSAGWGQTLDAMGFGASFLGLATGGAFDTFGTVVGLISTMVNAHDQALEEDGEESDAAVDVFNVASWQDTFVTQLTTEKEAMFRMRDQIVSDAHRLEVESKAPVMSQDTVDDVERTQRFLLNRENLVSMLSAMTTAEVLANTRANPNGFDTAGYTCTVDLHSFAPEGGLVSEQYDIKIYKSLDPRSLYATTVGLDDNVQDPRPEVRRVAFVAGIKPLPRRQDRGTYYRYGLAGDFLAPYFQDVPVKGRDWVPAERVPLEKLGTADVRPTPLGLNFELLWNKVLLTQQQEGKSRDVNCN